MSRRPQRPEPELELDPASATESLPSAPAAPRLAAERRRRAARSLGVDTNASDEACRDAYLRQIQAHPPDRDPRGFELIRDAYATLSDEVLRRAELLEGDLDPAAPLAGLYGDRGPRRLVGPDPWLAALSWSKPPRRAR